MNKIRQQQQHHISVFLVQLTFKMYCTCNVCINKHIYLHYGLYIEQRNGIIRYLNVCSNSKVTYFRM